ncbi:uncharacterized protein LOC132793938 [Drosophila nasuta]|uniref:uncharacterized protein LOC132793938 n=1 Tax=Drosophila nasuta TaxID=42062 RepID=UPI00295EFC9A|nr:uncharacterized protein LOC132793938 [Drosophila nasuta]
MDKSASNRSGSSQKDQNSLGILSMDNLKVFGDLSMMSSLSRNNSANTSRNKSDVNERLKAGRLKALETLEKPRSRSSYFSSSDVERKQQAPRHGTSRVSSAPSVSNFTNISDLITEETIDLNSSGSVLMPTPAPKAAQVFFEPGEITGRSTLCKNDSRASKQSRQVSVADILKSSFVEKARVQFAKRLEDDVSSHEQSRNSTSASTISDSFNYSRSLPRTADLSNSSLNGGGGFSFGSATGQGFDESFAPAELMQSKLVNGEISWAQEFAAVPTATLSKQALQKIAAPPQTPEIENSVSNSVLAGDPDFSLGNYFQMRSDSISNIVGNDERDELHSALGQLAPSPQTPISSDVETTPHVDNKTYTKAESAKMERNLMKKMQQDKFNKALQVEAKKKPPTSSELLSLSAIDEALRNMELNSDTSVGDVVNKFRLHGADDENKENDSTLCKSKSKLTDTMSFTDSLLNTTDFKQFQDSIVAPKKRQPLSPLADFNAPSILVTASDGHDADIDEWPSTPVKSPGRRVRHTKSPNSQRAVSPTSSDGVHTLPPTDEEDEDKTPVNKKHSLTVGTVRSSQNSFSSTRLDGCDALPSSTECDFGISPNLVKSVRNVSPLSSPRSCLSSPLLDSTTSSDRRMLSGAGASSMARRANSSPAASEASSTSGFSSVRKVTNGTQMSALPRSMSRSSNSSEFSHRDGKILPLKVTHTSLCWGSTKLRTDVRKSMQIKNTSDKRLVIRLSIQGPGFQLVGSDSNTITLQSMECRSICISFCPTVSGAAIGALSFYAPNGANNCQQPSMEIPLYGYGGNASITVQGLLKGPVGASFLTVGNVRDLAFGPLTACFKFYNKGPLTAFAGITVDSTVLLKPRLNAAFEVRPSKIILPPRSEAVVQIVFHPNREDVKNILKKTSQVLTLANMRIFCGDEPNRQRMRSLVQRMTGEQREQMTSSMLDNIWSTFPDEQPIRSISLLNEPPELILDLVTVVRIIDVALTLNRDFDESAEYSHLCLPDAEETVLFRTVCAANSPTPSNMMEPIDELHEADTTSAIDQQPMERNWSVQPEKIAFDFTGGSHAIEGKKFYVKNSFRSRQFIEISCNVPDLLQITPRESYIAPDGGQVEVTVHPLRTPRREMQQKDFQAIIEVAMENERINVPITFKA